jgi:RHS repeat-associated protein
MGALRSRSVLLVAMLGCVAALLVALLIGSPSQAESTSTASSSGATAQPFAAPPSGSEVPSLRTENSRTYRSGDGSLVAKISAGPVNYRDGAGDWQPIDTALRADGGGGLQTTAAAAELSLPQGLDDPVKVADGSRWVSFALDGADPDVTATAAGSTATYGGVLDGVDASYAAQPNGVKETLTIADGSAPSTYRFAIDASAGLTPSLRDDGAVVFRDGDGAPRFRLPAPTVQDADAAAATTSHVAYHLADDHQTLSVVVDPAWLAAAAFPVEVDPTVYLGGQSSCTLASGSLASTADCDGTTLKVGHDAAHTYRAAARFTGIAAAVPRTASIISGVLSMYLESQSVSGSTTPVNVVGLATGLGAGATWNTYNGTNAWTTPGGDIASGPNDALPALSTMYPSWSNDWVNFDIGQLAEKWVRDPATANNGLLVKAANEAANNVLSFDGTTWDHGSPTLSIEYELHPGHERDQTYESLGIDDRSSLSVNTISGNVAVDSDDINLPGVAGLNLDVSRTFNGQNLGDGSTLFGSAWTENINGSEAINRVRWYDDGRDIFANGNAIYRFDRDFANAGNDSTHQYYVTPPGIDADLVVDPTTEIGTLTYRKTGLKWIYSAPYNDSDVRLSQIKDRHGNTITLTYLAAHPEKLDYITDTFGRKLQFTYDFANAGKLTKITDASGRHWDYATDTTTSSGHRLLTGFTNPEGKTTTYHYDTGALPGTWDKLDKITDARGHDITLGYSGTTGDYSQVTSVTRPVDATSGHNIVWQFNYKPTAGTGSTCTGPDFIGKTVETDPESHTTTYCYNKLGQPIQVFDGNGRSVNKTYNAAANVATFTGLAGSGNPSLTTYKFSSNGSPQEASTAVGGSVEKSVIKYCGTGTDDTGTACTGTYALDKYLPATFTDTQGTTQGYTYNTTGDLSDVTTTSGSDHQTFTYTPDGHGNIATSKDGNLNTTSYTWTGDFLTKVAPPSPLAAQNFGPDALDRVKWAEDGNLVFACVTYDGVDRVTRVDWKTGVTGGDCATGTTAKWMTFTYDADGNLTQRADSAGNTTTYVYDWANRRTSETFPSSRTNTYAYDRASNLSSIVDPDGTVSYTYDNANRLKTIVSPKGAGTSTITYTYTDPPAGHTTDPSLQTISFPGGITQETKIDAAGNVLSVHVLNGATVLKKRDYSYQHGAGSVSALIQTMSDTSGNTTTYTPGAMNRLKDAVTTNGATTTESWHYDYDFAGNRLLRKHTVGATVTNTSYGYNAANELCYSVASTATGSCAAPPSGATTFSYDADGQRTSNPTAAFDQLQRMTTLSGTSLSYLSPGNGELVANGTTNYQNNLLGLARIIPPSGSATDIIRTPDGAPVAQRTGTTSKQDLFTDALGSVLATADDGATSLSRHYSYDPDGNASPSGAGTDSVVLYTGGYQIGNLYHYGARYYDPATATWTQQDPINQIGSLAQADRYTYAGGDPVNEVDPSGLAGGSEGGCELGPASLSGSRDDDASSSSGSYGVGLGAGAGCYGYRYQNDTGNGLSAGGHVCAVACVGYDTDSGFKFGLGVDVSIGVDINLSL